ncbi:MAG: DUF3810 domain-containing protein [Candidatus Gracilibacteria bacterium]|nr:DUF3810 domain-containing protein [Candidatus Gracilibacteria bacterium]
MCIIVTYDDMGNEIIDESCVNAIKSSLQHKENITTLDENQNVFDIIFVIMFTVVVSLYVIIIIVLKERMKGVKFNFKHYTGGILSLFCISAILGYTFLWGVSTYIDHVKDTIETKNLYHSELSAQPESILIIEE